MSRESKRKKIRKAIESHLKRSKILNVGDDIFSRRSIPTEHEALPVILIYPKTEGVDRNDHSPKSYQRILSLELECITTADDDNDLADELDDLAQCVEDSMEEFETLQGPKDPNCLLNQLDLNSVVYDTEGEGFSPVGSVKLTYNLEYYTEEGISDDELVPFKKMGTDWDLDNEDDEIDAQDVLKLPQE